MNGTLDVLVNENKSNKKIGLNMQTNTLVIKYSNPVTMDLKHIPIV
jgi:hypothetical protein